MDSKRIATDLRRELGGIVSYYPPDTTAVIKHTEKTAFFPVGNGTYNQCESDSEIDILVLGQDFGTAEYTKSITDGNSEDSISPTWNNMIALFNHAGVNPGRCFFSNVFMGLRTTNKMTGIYPGYKDNKHKNQSLEFLRFQITTIKPRAIITLGKVPAEMLAQCTSPELDLWNGDHLVRDVKLSSELSCVCVSLVHPSMRNSNVGKRAYGEFQGNEAEIVMLKTMLKTLENMDGFEATKRIRDSGRPDASAVQIIAFTANAFNEDIEKSLANGMNAHVAKPVEPDLLGLALAEALQARKRL